MLALYVCLYVPDHPIKGNRSAAWFHKIRVYKVSKTLVSVLHKSDIKGLLTGNSTPLPHQLRGEGKHNGTSPHSPVYTFERLREVVTRAEA